MRAAVRVPVATFQEALIRPSPRTRTSRRPHSARHGHAHRSTPVHPAGRAGDALRFYGSWAPWCQATVCSCGYSRDRSGERLRPQWRHLEGRIRVSPVRPPAAANAASCARPRQVRRGSHQRWRRLGTPATPRRTRRLSPRSANPAVSAKSQMATNLSRVFCSVATGVTRAGRQVVSVLGRRVRGHPLHLGAGTPVPGRPGRAASRGRRRCRPP